VSNRPSAIFAGVTLKRPSLMAIVISSTSFALNTLPLRGSSSDDCNWTDEEFAPGAATPPVETFFVLWGRSRDSPMVDSRSFVTELSIFTLRILVHAGVYQVMRVFRCCFAIL